MSVGKQINELYVNALGRRRLCAGEAAEAIARSDGRCVVRIHLDPDSEGEASGREYFRD